MPPALPPPEWASATLPKAGNRPEDNEDATAVAADGCRSAVADGATEGWESRPWAGHLADALVRQPPTPADFKEWLAGVRAAWVPPAPSGPVPWYAAAKQEEGSFATALGLDLRRTPSAPGWGWRAVAVGDACLFHVRAAELLAAFPVATGEGFTNRPALVPSSAVVPCPEPEWLAGRAAPGDVFLLATDAAAARLLAPRELPAALTAVREALRSRNPGPLEAWLRTAQAAVNDDVTMVAVRLPTPEEVR